MGKWVGRGLKGPEELFQGLGKGTGLVIGLEGRQSCLDHPQAPLPPRRRGLEQGWAKARPQVQPLRWARGGVKLGELG